MLADPFMKQKSSRHCPLIWVCPLLLMLVLGCRGIGTQTFTALPSAKAPDLEKSSRVVLDVVYQRGTAMADYNLWENLSMLAPMPEHWKYDSTLQVERVIKGQFEGKLIELHWLREITSTQYESLGIPPRPSGDLTNGTPLRVGFDGFSGKRLKNLKLTLRPEATN
jgi:hypothetical protein